MNTKLLEVVMDYRDKFSPKVATASARVRGSMAKMSASVKSVMTSFSGLVAVIGGLIILRQAAQWMGESVEMANEQERAVMSLNASLAAAGNYSEAASVGLQSYATELQNTLGIGDELTLETMSIIEGLTKLSGEALPEAMRAVVQISALYKVDYKNASILLGKTLTSNINAFSRYGIEVDLSGDKTERLAQIVEATAGGFDVARAQVDNFSGRMMIATAAWGDMREAVGRYITQSPIVNNIIEVLTDAIIEKTEAIDGARQSGEDLVGITFAKIIRGGLWLAKAVYGIRDAFYAAAYAVDYLALKMIQLLRWMNQHPIAAAGMGGPLGAAVAAASLLIGAEEVDRQLAVAESAFSDKLIELGDDLSAFASNQEYLNSLMEAVGNSVNITSNAIENSRQPIQNAADDVNSLADAGNAAADAIERLGLAVSGLKFEDVFPTEITREPVTSIADFMFGEYRREEIKQFETMQRLGARPGREVPFTGVPGIETGIGENGRAFAFDWESFAAQGITNFARGGFGGFAQGALPVIGTAFGGPIGGAIGSLLGSLFGGKKKQRGNDPSKPVFVSDINLANAMTDLLNITKLQLGRAGAGGINAINSMIRAQAGTAGAS